MSIIDFGKKDMKNLLSNDVFYIPDYQRPYSWGEDEQIAELLEDIIFTLNEEKDSHFYGQIVIHNNKEEGRKYIIDGQQRISTIVILLSAIKSIFDEMVDGRAKHKSQDISIKYIGRYDEEINELNLFLGEIDKEFFKEYIQCDNRKAKDKKPSHTLIKEAYDYFYKKLNEFADKETEEDSYEIIKDIYNVVLDKLTVMFVITDDLEEAFIIFETLNSRGKQLETSDLLKNYLFRMAASGDVLEEVKNNWMETITTLNGIDVTKFLRHLWNSSYLFVREKGLYRRIKQEIDNKTKCKNFSKLFKDMAYYYRLF